MIFRKILFFLVLTCLVALLCCKPARIITKESSTSPTAIKSSDNNVVVVDSENTRSSPNSNDEIIFEGNNNLFELVQRNSSYFDEARDVIIIKGNNIIMKLVNVNVLDNSIGRSDTLIIVGNNEKYVVDMNNSIETNSTKINTYIVNLKEKDFDSSPYFNEFIQNDTPIWFSYFNKRVTARYAYSYFYEKLDTDEPLYFYELAEMYLYGIGVEESSLKAIELYEHAAARNHIPSLTKLGIIYSGKFGVKRNKDKLIYYYKKCASLGDNYCSDQLKNELAK